jgi:thiamine-phosphate pyrophosphorylase
VITDFTLGRELLLTRLSAALSAGKGIAVQHRHPGATDRAFFEEAVVLQGLCADFKAPLFINSRLDVALALGAHLHCTGASLPPVEVRAALGPDRLISVALHRDDAVDLTIGADLALVSPVFPPGSKPGDERAPLGVEGFTELARRLPCPAFALGGITEATAPQLQGDVGLAVISSVLQREDPRAAAAALLATRRG